MHGIFCAPKTDMSRCIFSSRLASWCEKRSSVRQINFVQSHSPLVQLMKRVLLTGYLVSSTTSCSVASLLARTSVLLLLAELLLSEETPGKDSAMLKVWPVVLSASFESSCGFTSQDSGREFM